MLKVSTLVAVKTIHYTLEIFIRGESHLHMTLHISRSVEVIHHSTELHCRLTTDYTINCSLCVLPTRIPYGLAFADVKGSFQHTAYKLQSKWFSCDCGKNRNNLLTDASLTWLKSRSIR